MLARFMTDSARDPQASNPPSVVFCSAYGGLPRFFWYAVIPFLLLASGVLFVRAVWFGEGMRHASFQISPSVIAYGVCPFLWFLCGLLVAFSVYRIWNPQQILVTTRDVRLPKGRLTAETVSIAWNNLEATLTTKNLQGWHLYEIHCKDLNHETSVQVASLLFRDLDDFATFLLIMGHHMGQEWSIPGFRPGTLRGDQAALNRFIQAVTKE